MIEPTVTVNCFRVTRTGEVFVGTFQLSADEARARHGKTFYGYGDGCDTFSDGRHGYRWEVAYPSLLGL